MVTQDNPVTPAVCDAPSERLTALCRGKGCLALGVCATLAALCLLPGGMQNLRASTDIPINVITWATLAAGLLFSLSFIVMYFSPERGVRMYRAAATGCAIFNTIQIAYALYLLTTGFLQIMPSLDDGTARGRALAEAARGSGLLSLGVSAVLYALMIRFFWLRSGVGKNMKTCMDALPWARENARKAKGYCMAGFVLGIVAAGALALLAGAGQSYAQEMGLLPEGVGLIGALYAAGLVLGGVALYMEYRFYKAAQEIGL